MNKSFNILLLDGQSVQAISISKYLKRNNYRVIIFCDTKLSYGYSTRYADEKYISPKTDHEDFGEFLYNFLENNHIDGIIPLNDNSAEFLSLNKNKLIKLTKFIIPDKDVFYKGYNKNELMSICDEFNFPHPATVNLIKESIETASSKIGFPSLIKPNMTTGGRGITLVNSEDELIKLYPEILAKHGSCHLQQFIPMGGRQYKVQIYLDKNNKILGSTVIHKIRFYPENGGSSCCNVTVKDDKLVALCANVLKQINWIGFADFDLIEDTRDGIFKIIEINPRVPACIKSSLISGVDFATIIANDTLGLNVQQFAYKPGKYLRFLGLDLLWFIHSKNKFTTTPNWFCLIGKNISYQEGGVDDFLPFIYGTIGSFFKQLKPEFRKNKSGMRNKI